jgi:MFS family permease
MAFQEKHATTCFEHMPALFQALGSRGASGCGLVWPRVLGGKLTANSDVSGRDVGAIEAIRAASGRSGLIAAWLVLILALCGPVLTSFQSTVVAPLGSTIAHHFGGGNHGALVAQLAITLPCFGVILGGPLTAWLIRQAGYRPVIVVNAVLLALAGSAGAYLDNMAAFLLSRFVVGLTMVALYSALVALTGVLYRGVTLSRMISYQNGLSAIMGMGLVLVSGRVASAFGWRMSFLLYLVAAVFAVLAVFAWLPSKAPTMKHEPNRAKVSLKPLVPLYVISIGVYVIVFMVIVQGSLLMAANGIENPSLQSTVIALSTIAYAGTATACSWIETHLTRGWTFTAGLTSLAAGLLIMGGVPSIWGAGLGSLLLGAGSGLGGVYLVKLIVERAPEGARERAVGFIAPTHYIGQLSNPFIMQTLRVTIGIQRAFLLVGAVLVVSAVVAALSHMRRSSALTREGEQTP